MRNASLPRRGAAYLVDLCLLQLLLATIARVFAVEDAPNPLGAFRLPGLSYHMHWGNLLWVGTALFYAWFLLFETLTTMGSPGKVLFGLRLRNEKDLVRVSFRRSLARTTCKWILTLLGPFLLLYLLFARKRALPHDRWTGVSIGKRSALRVSKWPVATDREKGF